VYIIEDNTARDMGPICRRPALVISAPWSICRSSAAASLPGKGSPVTIDERVYRGFHRPPKDLPVE
jgi:hypothetical protein